MPKISVIVPVYNVERYLERCIESILSQTFRDFELILINDGSTDSSGEICNAYKVKDKRIKVIHQKNNGVSAARNNGINNAIGEYIQFVDSDDWIEKELFEENVTMIERDKSDILFFGFKYEDEDRNLIKEKGDSNCFIKGEKSKLNEYAIELFKKDLFGYTWCKLFKLSIIKQHNILFDESISFCEDEKFTCRYYSYISSCSNYQTSKYHYIKYIKERKSLCSTIDSGDMHLRDTVFKEWINMLEEDDSKQNKKYLLDKSYIIIRYLFSNIVWRNYSNKIKKDEANKLKKTYMYKYFKENAINLSEYYLKILIELKLFNLFKIGNLITEKFKGMYR